MQIQNIGRDRYSYRIKQVNVNRLHANEKWKLKIKRKNTEWEII